MKKSIKITAVLAALVAFAFTGCSNFLSNASVSSNSSAESEVTYKQVTLFATGDSELISFPAADASLRTITAAKLDSSTLHYYLNYKKLVGTQTTAYDTTDYTFTASSADTPNVGSISITLEDSYYEFTLWACKDSVTLAGTSADESTLNAAAVLRAKTSVDLRNSTNNVHFYLTPNGLTGTSNINIDLYSDGWTLATDYKGYTFTAGIYDVTTGAVVGAATTASSTLPAAAGDTADRGDIQPHGK